MKNIKNIALLFLFVSSSLFVSCEADSDTLTGGAELGGLLSVKKEAITYVIGNGQDKNYDNKITIYQGNEKVQKIDVYKTFTTTKTVNGEVVEVTSNSLLLKTLTLPVVAQTEVVAYSTTYNELVAGLTLDGSPVATSDGNLKIGDYFTLKYVSTLNNGKVHENYSKTKMSVGTRLAGTYTVIETAYWRIGVPRPDVTWAGQTRIIESVDAITYRFLNYAGPFVGENTHYFTVDPLTNIVNTPEKYNGVAQILNLWKLTNCDTASPYNMPNACGAFPGLQNIVVKDDVNGKDKIYRTYGYYTETGAAGSREIYEVLEKVVD